MCLWRYTPAEIVSGVPRTRQREFIPLLSIDIIFPPLFALIVFFIFARERDFIFFSKLLVLFCAFIISLNFP